MRGRLTDQLIADLRAGLRVLQGRGHAITEAEIVERANNLALCATEFADSLNEPNVERVAELLTEKERLTYHLVKLYARIYTHAGKTKDPELVDALGEPRAFLTEIGYAPSSSRATQMLELGEPGRRDDG